VQTGVGAFITVLGSIAAALLFLVVLYRVWAPSRRRATNDVVGPSVGVIGTMYAVLIAFMLSGVWQNFQSAQVNAEQESNCLVDLFRFSDNLAPEDRQHIQDLARNYAHVMIDEEWPLMRKNSIDDVGRNATHELWTAVTRIQARNPNDAMMLDHALTQLNTLTEHRRIRLLESRTQLPPILWSLLIIGGIVTVASTCLFGADSLRTHMVQVFAIAFLVSLTLVAIAQVDRPYQGDVRVEPDGFRFALDSFDHWAH
jgi:hypothetical protein